MPDLFGNYKLAINHPDYFFGRSEIISEIVDSPFEVRVILGERRLGKTSTLNAIRWSLLDVEDPDKVRALPILIDLQQEQPQSLDNFRYILIERLRETILNPKQEKCLLFDLRQIYHRFLRQIEGANVSFFEATKLNVANPERERSLIHEDFSQDLVSIIQRLQTKNCQGVCFLFDGAEYLVKQSWVDDVWAYLRSLKDTNNTVIKSFLGLVLAGYRDLKDYHQQIGSPLFNIAEITWLSTLTPEEIRDLIKHRSQHEKYDTPDDFINRVIELGGCHPFLTHQALNAFFANSKNKSPLLTEKIERNLIKELQIGGYFKTWWETRFSLDAQKVYLALMQEQESSLDSLGEKIGDLSINDIEYALETLAGSGVIRRLDSETYRVGAKLFAQWVKGTIVLG